MAPANIAVPAQAPVRPMFSNTRTGIHQMPHNSADPNASQSGRFVLRDTFTNLIVQYLFWLMSKPEASQMRFVFVELILRLLTDIGRALSLKRNELCPKI
jgi:hypothetical protein